ncbi:MAG: presenilin family intramembrane aspartyl protease PSH [Thermoplasmata archaeon]|nr:hypothetical protein [Staphylococcus epidermidis]
MKNISIILLFFTYINVILLSIILGIMFYPISYGSLGNETNNPGMALYYFIILILFTVFMIFLLRKKLEIVLKGIYFFVIGIILFFISTALISLLPIDPLIIIFLSLFISISVPIFIWIRPSWIAIDILGLFTSSGAAALIGTSLGIIPIIVLMVILIFYDIFAVLISKHMVTLAEGTIKTGLPALFIFPEEEKIYVKEIYENGKKNAFFMGFGDAAIPSMLVVSSLINYSFISTIFTFLGLVISLFILFHFLGKNRPLPGLPFLNTGALVGFFISLLILRYI